MPQEDKTPRVKSQDPGEQYEGYAACLDCNQPMVPGTGCTLSHITCNGVLYERVKAGDDLDFIPDMDDDEVCHDCNAMRGQYHHCNCDAETCPACHGQLIGCDCEIETGEDD